MQLWMLSFFSLIFVTATCMFGAISKTFHDNLLQRVGMAVLAIGCSSRVQAIFETQAVKNDWVLVHVGMAIIAGGTMLRVVLRELTKRQERRNKRRQALESKD